MAPKCRGWNAPSLFLSSAVECQTVLPRMPKKPSPPFYWCTVKRALTFHLTLTVVSTQCCRNTREDDRCLPTISAASTSNAAAEEHSVPSLTSLPIPPTASFPSCIVGGDLAVPLDCWTPRQLDTSAPSPHNMVPKNPHRELEFCCPFYFTVTYQLFI